MSKEVKYNRTSNTGFKGIHTHKKTGMFEARFNYKGKYEYLGSFQTITEAIRARTSYIIGLL